MTRNQILLAATGLYSFGFVVHTFDHLRRGTSTVSTEVLVLGSVASVLQVAAIGSVLLRHRLGPLLAALVGLPDAAGIAAVHLVPKWSVLSDAFPGAHGTGVTAFSWFAAIAEIVGALAFGWAGLWVLRRPSGRVRVEAAAH